MANENDAQHASWLTKSPQDLAQGRSTDTSVLRQITSTPSGTGPACYLCGDSHVLENCPRLSVILKQPRAASAISRRLSRDKSTAVVRLLNAIDELWEGGSNSAENDDSSTEPDAVQDSTKAHEDTVLDDDASLETVKG